MKRNGVPEHRSIVVIDMAASSRWDNVAQARARAALDGLVRAAFRSAGIARRKLYVEGRGDGTLVLVPPSVSKVDLVDPFIPVLMAGLRLLGAQEVHRVSPEVGGGFGRYVDAGAAFSPESSKILCGYRPQPSVLSEANGVL